MKSELSICIVDNAGGVYLPIARHLSKYFNKVYYHTVNQNPFPRYGLDMIGTGYPEIRYTENKLPFFTDPCMRAGSPPSNTLLTMIGNWNEVIVGLCEGTIVEPQWVAKYGVEIILKSPYCNNNYLPVTFPMEFDDNIKLKGSFRLNGKDYVIPWSQSGFDMEEFGSVVVVGDDIQTIAQEALDICSKIEAYKMRYEANAINIAMEQIGKVEKALNIKF